MILFPTIKDLAISTLDQVIKAWEGLGYYSRARNLHEGAQYVLKHFNGVLPHDEEELKKIKGLGPYTVGAILNFAFHQKIPAVDGNVLRVISRLFAIEEDISKASTQKTIRNIVSGLLPNDEPWIVSEALIELGATICQKKAKCYICPINKNCMAFQKGISDQLPVKLKKQETIFLNRLVAIVQWKSSFLVKRGEKGKIMSDLYEFPYLEINDSHDQHLNQYLIDLGLKCNFQKKLENVKHTFTRYRVQLQPSHFFSLNHKVIENYDWVEFHELKKLAFSSGHRRILNVLTLDDPLPTKHLNQ